MSSSINISNYNYRIVYFSFNFCPNFFSIHPGMFYVWACFCVWDLKNQKSLVVYYAHCSLSLCFCTLFLSLNSSQGSFYFNIYIPLSASLFLDDYYISLYDFHNSFNQSLLSDTWVVSSFLLFQIVPQCISFVHIWRHIYKINPELELLDQKIGTCILSCYRCCLLPFKGVYSLTNDIKVCLLFPKPLLN